jgi:DNA-binding CsgD family transcriptional regulator
MGTAKLEVDEKTGRVLSEVITGFYHYSAVQSTAEFVHRMMSSMSRVIGFDAACWVTFSNNGLATAKSTVHLFHLAANFSSGYQPFLQQLSGSPKVLQGPPSGKNTSTTLDFFGEEIDRYLSSYDVQQQAIQLASFERTNHLLCLFSNGTVHSLGQQQLQTSLFLLENAARAFEHHLHLKLENQWFYEGSYKAITDLKGRLLASGPGFEACMTELVPHWQNDMLSELIEGRRLPAKQDLGRYKMRIKEENGFCSVEVYPFELYIEQLTEAEIDVAKYLIKGLSVGQIAEIKKLSHRTIANQQNSIYRKLVVSKNAEMVSMLVKSKYRVFFGDDK